jgi:ADP-ribose pyrophosphatase YjhB (NUDIX family)
MALIEQDDKVLLINHRGLNPQNCFWMPPGGGINAGEKVLDCIIREVDEEVNLRVLSCEFYCSNEYISNSLHAVELFFESKVADYNAQLGFDPEVSADNQFMIEIKWMSKEAVCKLDESLIHPVIKKYVTFKTQVQA